MATLIWIEHDGQHYHQASLNLIEAAKQFKQDIVAVLMGQGITELATELARLDGLSKVIVLEGSCFFPFRAEVIAKALFDMSADYDVFLACATSQGKNILPRFAGLMRQGMLSDVIEIKNKQTFVHPIYAGNALAVSSFQQRNIIVSIRASAFAKTSIHSQTCPIEYMAFAQDDSRVKVVAQAKRDMGKIDLQTARVVVAGGRGFGSKENFQRLDVLAKRIGAAVAATRAAVDAGFASNEFQVGQTGKIVAPELYIAIGISGAIQHLAGMKDSKVIVAINCDPDAPIFEIASFGLVGDLFQILPMIHQALENNQ